MSHINSSVMFIENRLKGTQLAWQDTKEPSDAESERIGSRLTPLTVRSHHNHTRMVQSAPPNRKRTPRKYTARNELSRHRLAVTDSKYQLIKDSMAKPKKKKRSKRKRKAAVEEEYEESEQNKEKEEGSFQVLTKVLTKMQIEDVLPQRSFFSLSNNVYGAHRRYQIRGHSAGEGTLNAEYSLDNEIETAVSLEHQVYAGIDESVNTRPQLEMNLLTDEYENKAIHVDPEPLIKYLKLVRENPEEYKAIKTANVESHNSLLSLGKVFARRHLGLGRADSLIVHAAYEIKPKVYVGIKKKEKKEQKGQKLHFDPYAKVTEHQKKEEVTGSPLQMAWKEVDKWMKELTMAQFVKAREVAIRELGEEERSIKRWWVAHKYCRYLRHRGSTDVL